MDPPLSSVASLSQNGCGIVDHHARRGGRSHGPAEARPRHRHREAGLSRHRHGWHRARRALDVPRAPCIAPMRPLSSIPLVAGWVPTLLRHRSVVEHARCRPTPIRTHRREAATGPHLNLKSVKKINVGNCQPIVLACSVITTIWQLSYNSFSDNGLEVMACDRSFPPVGPSSSHSQ
jgi:hypothetical protein